MAHLYCLDVIQYVGTLYPVVSADNAAAAAAAAAVL